MNVLGQVKKDKKKAKKDDKPKKKSIDNFLTEIAQLTDLTEVEAQYDNFIKSTSKRNKDDIERLNLDIPSLLVFARIYSQNPNQSYQDVLRKMNTQQFSEKELLQQFLSGKLEKLPPKLKTIVQDALGNKTFIRKFIEEEYNDSIDFTANLKAFITKHKAELLAWAAKRGTTLDLLDSLVIKEDDEEEDTDDKEDNEEEDVGSGEEDAGDREDADGIDIFGGAGQDEDDNDTRPQSSPRRKQRKTEFPDFDAMNDAEYAEYIRTHFKIPSRQQSIIRDDGPEVVHLVDKPQRPSISVCERLYMDSPWVSSKHKVKIIYIHSSDLKSIEPYITSNTIDIGGVVFYRPKISFFSLLCSGSNTKTQNGNILTISPPNISVTMAYILSNRDVVIRDNKIERDENEFIAGRYINMDKWISIFQEKRFSELDANTIELLRDEARGLFRDFRDGVEIEDIFYNNSASVYEYLQQIVEITGYFLFNNEETVFLKRLKMGFFKGYLKSLTGSQKIGSENPELRAYFNKMKQFQIKNVLFLLKARLSRDSKHSQLLEPVVNANLRRIFVNNVPKNPLKIKYKNNTYNIMELHERFKQRNFTLAEDSNIVDIISKMNLDQANIGDLEEVPEVPLPPRPKRTLFNIFTYIDEDIKRMRRQLQDSSDKIELNKICAFCKTHIQTENFMQSIQVDKDAPAILSFCNTKCVEQHSFGSD
jgi:hypothetical protein